VSEVIGMDKLLHSLKVFPERVQKNVLSGAVRAGTKPILTEAKIRVPKDTGNLKKSLGVIKRRSRDKTKLRFSITPRKGGKNDGFYAHMIEFGTSRQQAQPFMRPAFENKANECLSAVKDYMAKRIEKEIIKARA